MDPCSSHCVVQGYYSYQNGAWSKHFDFLFTCFVLDHPLSMCMELHHSFLMVPRLLQHGLWGSFLAAEVVLREIEVMWPSHFQTLWPWEPASLFSSCALLNVLTCSLLILAPSSLTSSHIPLSCLPRFPGSFPPGGAMMHPTHGPHTSRLGSQTHVLAVSPFWPLHSLVRHFFSHLLR